MTIRGRVVAGHGPPECDGHFEGEGERSPFASTGVTPGDVERRHDITT